MKAFLIIMGAALLALVSLFLIFLFWLSTAPPPPAEPHGTTGVSTQEPARGSDIGRGVPGASCSTDRLGKSFELGGKTYVCSGPKPYRWREAR
jgi:hypothetical protein